MAASTLTDFDLYLFGQGNHYRIYEKLGAHLEVHDGVSGTQFAVWAPNANGVSVVGDFNQWNGLSNRLHGRGDSGIWQGFVPHVGPGAIYKYEIHPKSGPPFLKADPYGFAMQLRPESGSVVTTLDGYAWGDGDWIRTRSQTDPKRAPINIYEVHLGSWKRPWDQRTPPFMSWTEACEHLIPYAKEMGYTHIELMGVAEHPLDESWGYQVVGYFAPTARYGPPRDLMAFVDRCHRAGIGVILDWVPAHFPKDQHGLAWFDGTALYEHADPRLGEHQDWGTKIFNYGRHEVRNFLVANALYWFDRFHIDGLRVDAVASMLYLDYSRNEGEWLPNPHGGRENLEAIDFLRQANAAVATEFPGGMMIAEESTAFAGVTRASSEGGLGFTFKWNMGWMNDTLRYMSRDPVYRRFDHHLLTFSFVYAWSESFILPISHDEVVHGKASLLSKMPGDEWQKRANFRLLLAYMLAHPGKKLLFMGSELGQWNEWRDGGQLDWQLLEHENHRALQYYVRELNHLYQRSPQLFTSDCDHGGFAWIEVNNANESIWAFERRTTGPGGSPPLICAFNGTPVPRPHYALRVHATGEYRKLIDSDDARFGGSGHNGQSVVRPEASASDAHALVLRVNLPPLGAVFYSI